MTRNPSIFLFDEPLSNLDAALRMDMRMELGKLHDQLATMIYATHDQVEAMTLADKIVVLKDGQAMQIGSPMELYNNPANLLVAGFLGAPSRNFLQVDVLERQADGAKVSNPSLEPIVVRTAGRPIAAGRKATLGVRPQHLRVSDKGRLHGNVILAERLGSETVADFRLDDGPKLIAAFAEDKILEDGQRLSLDFDADAVHLFPAEG